MASIHQESSRHWRVTFTERGTHKNIRLGKCTKNDAKTALIYIERLISAKRLASAPDGEAIAWLNRLDDTVHCRIVKAGLTPPRKSQDNPTLQQLTNRFTQNFAGKTATLTFYGHTIRNLLAYFNDAQISDITAQAADEFRAWLEKDQKLSNATIGRRVIACRTIWKKGQRWKMVTDNPFTEVKGGQQVNESRKQFVRPEPP
ncbi:MAG: phage integrase SAM-like domain-containing protein [Phycisphaerae bacterium]